ncbi:hypothetical protein LL963_17200, partial [Xanthomonas campestris pv. esculenti]|nr:hypothetical protein [Xanthomonas campestris pv. esculenti]
MPPRSYMDVLAACPAMVGGQGPCSKGADNPICAWSTWVEQSGSDDRIVRVYRDQFVLLKSCRGEDTTPQLAGGVLNSEDAASPSCQLLVETRAHRPSPLILACPHHAGQLAGGFV